MSTPPSPSERTSLSRRDSNLTVLGEETNTVIFDLVPGTDDDVIVHLSEVVESDLEQRDQRTQGPSCPTIRSRD